MEQISPEQHATTPKKEKNTGSLVGIIIIVLVLVLGGLYVWGMRLQRELAPDTNTIGTANEAFSL